MTDRQKMVEVLVSDVLTVPIHEIKFNVPKWLKDEKELCFMYAKKKDKPLTEQVELYWMRTSDTEEIESKKKFLSFIYGEENVKTYKYTKPRIGIELDKEYFEIARKRIDKLSDKER